MSETANKKHRTLDAITVGFALFAIFFGAGNLIFPPSLGQLSGSKWWIAFLAFLLADAGIAVAAVLSVVRREGTLEDQLGRLGRPAARLICVVLMLCIGPAVIVPRTCATTFELSIKPLLPGLSSWLFSPIFFGLVAALTIRPSSVVDIIGKILTPVLLIMLLVLCAKGLLTPLGPIADPDEDLAVFRMGLFAGYQTMDALTAIPLSIIIVKSLIKRGYTEKKEKIRMVKLSCLVAVAGLFVVYAGLCYLGATTSSLNLNEITNASLLVRITELLLARGGIVILSVIVFLACLTTAIGVTSSVADYTNHLFKGRLSYEASVLLICLAGFLISNLGITSIVSIAEPVLNLLLPLFLTQMVLSFFSDRIRSDWVFRGAALGSLIYSILEILYIYFGIVTLPLFPDFPLFSLGLGWILPAVAGGLLGWLLSALTKKQEGRS